MSMTENKAINGLKNLFIEHELDLAHTDSLKVLQIAIKALEEIQQYRAIGTVRQINDFIADWRLGNLEECRVAVEKMKPKKPILARSMMTKREYQICPICERCL